MTFDLDIWPNDLNINRDHLLLTKFEASGAKRFGVINCTMWSRLTWPLTLDLLTWISIGIIYSSRTIYLPSLKLLGQKRSWVISCTRLRENDWPTDRQTDMCKAICPSYFEGGIIRILYVVPVLCIYKMYVSIAAHVYRIRSTGHRTAHTHHHYWRETVSNDVSFIISSPKSKLQVSCVFKYHST